jgi:predicted ribosome quality control (RQC) complex YloA/Tae2 family protein
MNEPADEYLRSLAPLFARLNVWGPRFAPAQHRLTGTSLQKMTASDDGYVCLAVYAPGDDRSAAVMSIRPQDPGVLLSHSKPKPQIQPNAFIQIARKYLVGRRIRWVHCSIEPTCFFIELEPVRHQASPSNRDTEQDSPDTIILDLGCKPARLIIARKHREVPDRYQSVVTAHWPTNHVFYESYCEWTVDTTKTKRRATFEQPLVTYCWLRPAQGTQLPARPTLPKTIQRKNETPPEDTPEHEFGHEEKRAFSQDEMNLSKALALLPVHIRRAARTRLQFLERRLLRQIKDLPHESEINAAVKRAEGLRAHLYLWPDRSNTWYVPPEIMEASGLPSFLQLSAGQKPGDVLDAEFRQVDRLKRRRSELLERVAESRRAVDHFGELVVAAGQAIWESISEIAPEGRFGLADLGLYFARIRPPQADALCRELSLSWQETEGRRERQGNSPKDGKRERLPFRTFYTSNGEAVHVARSATEGDAMLRIMPSHHTWLHVLVGEGSHVWLEKPKKVEPSPQSLREAAILAIHNSRLSRGRQGEVRVATRADIEKKKDLPPGKVIVRRCRTILIKYDNEDLEAIMSRPPPSSARAPSNGGV